MLTEQEIMNKILPRCINDNDCLVWTGPVHKKGAYAMASGKDRKSVALHVAIYEHFVAKIEYGMVIRHSCNNKICLNREHMYLVPHGETMRLDPFDVLAKNTKVMSSGCIEWTRKYHSFGYGSVKMLGETYVHRLAYKLFRGVIPDGMLVCHTCDNPKCCNPEHLFLGTHQDNSSDCVRKGRTWDRSASKNPNSTLSEIDVIDVRRKFNEGQKMSSLAREYGVQSPAISKIVKYRTWKSISQTPELADLADARIVLSKRGVTIC